MSEQHTITPRLKNSVFDLDDQIHDQRLAIRLFLSAEVGQGLSEKLPFFRDSRHGFSRVLTKELGSISLIVNIAAFQAPLLA